MENNLIKNNKGQIEFIFIWFIVALIIIFIFVGWTYFYGQINTILNDVEVEGTNNATIHDATTKTWGEVNNAMPILQWVSLFFIFGLIMGIFVGFFFVQEHPWIIGIYFLLIVLSVILSIPISNAYADIIVTEPLASTFAGYQGANYIFLNLPLIVSIVGLFGIGILFVGYYQKGYGGGVGY